MGALMALCGYLDVPKHPGCIKSRDAPHMNVFDEKYDRASRSLKTVKIEGYNSRFYTSTGPVH